MNKLPFPAGGRLEEIDQALAASVAALHHVRVTTVSKLLDISDAQTRKLIRQLEIGPLIELSDRVSVVPLSSVEAFVRRKIMASNAPASAGRSSDRRSTGGKWQNRRPPGSSAAPGALEPTKPAAVGNLAGHR